MFACTKYDIAASAAIAAIGAAEFDQSFTTE